VHGRDEEEDVQGIDGLIHSRSPLLPFASGMDIHNS
jgi:hypothetical protein